MLTQATVVAGRTVSDIHVRQTMKPRVTKDNNLWKVTFGKYPPGYSAIHFASWERAIEAANRGCGKDPVQAAFDEQFLLSADRALNKMLREREIR
jgi:hypothetical protein